MAAYSNPLPMTQATVRRSFKSDEKDNANTPKCDIREPDSEGESGYQVRSEDELSKVEQSCLNALNGNPMAKKLIKLDFATLFEGPKTQLETWPLFFCSKEESGIELQQGLVTLWSNFLIEETLMAAISIQPLVMVPNITHDWQLKLYGYTWMISIISDLWGIAITALFLGFLLGCPNKVPWKWMCEIGWVRSIPTVLVLLETILTSTAIACTCWIIYGSRMGIVCVVVEAVFLVTMYKLADILYKARDRVTVKNM